MENTFKLQVLTPDGPVYEGEAVAVTLPGEDGYFGVLASHAPLVGTLGKGTMTIRERDFVVHHMQLEGGFVEVVNNTATVLADSVEATA